MVQQVVQRKKAPKRTSTTIRSGSVVDHVTDHIAFEIASGVRAPGDRLSSVRALASEHAINPSTVQIVLSRLRAAGFVDAEHIVRDIELYGGIDTWRYLFRFAQKMPDRATKLFENFLATRRVLVLEVVRALAKDRGAFDVRTLRRAVERLEILAQSGAEPEEFARAELHAARIFMSQADQPVLLALYNTIAEILLTVPAVLGAMYAQPAFNVGMWRGLLERWDRPATLATVEAELEGASAALTLFHVACVERFRSLL
jgi:GntR family transcriptional regulator, transcriptional repressor for pyruvate dehydrogenase complex